jgi:cytochrome c556
VCTKALKNALGEGGLAMRGSLKVLTVGAALAGLALAMPVGLAADKEQVIKERQTLMKKQGADLGAVKGFIDGKNDLAKATAGATDLVADIKKIPDVFPPGSEGPNPEGKFAPKPAVWSDWKDFLAQRDAAMTKAEALLTAVKGGDKAKIQTAFADMGKNGCGGCHGKFREELKK